MDIDERPWHTLSPEIAAATLSVDPRRGLEEGETAALRKRSYAGPVAVTVHGEENAHALKKVGAELIFHLYFDAAEYAVDKLQHILRENEAPA